MITTPTIGMHVRVVKNNYNGNSLVGRTGTIIAYRSGNKQTIKVLFNGGLNGNREVTLYEDGAAIWFDADELEAS
jgi:RNase P/RNase MRP subunit p29